MSQCGLRLSIRMMLDDRQNVLPASPFVHQMSRSCITELAITKLVIPILFDSSPILVDSLPILFDSLVDSIQWILAWWFTNCTYASYLWSVVMGRINYALAKSRWVLGCPLAVRRTAVERRCYHAQWSAMIAGSESPIRLGVWLTQSRSQVAIQVAILNRWVALRHWLGTLGFDTI